MSDMFTEQELKVLLKLFLGSTIVSLILLGIGFLLFKHYQVI